MLGLNAAVAIVQHKLAILDFDAAIISVVFDSYGECVTYVAAGWLPAAMFRLVEDMHVIFTNTQAFG